MIERCPFCTCIVAEDDAKCPSCQRDLSYSPPPPAAKSKPPHAKPQAPSFVGYPSFVHEDKKVFRTRGDTPWGKFIDWRLELVFSVTGAVIFFLALTSYFNPGGNNSSKSAPAKIQAAMIAPESLNIQGLTGNPSGGVAQHPALSAGPRRIPRSYSRVVPGLRPVKNSEQPASGKGPWAFHGAIYDLTTLEPIKLVHIIFTDMKKNKKFETYSRFDGHFKMVLPAAPGRGYFLELDHSRYESHRFAVMDYAKVSGFAKTKRKAMAEDLYKTLQNPSGITPRSNGRLDIWLVPRRQ